MSNIISNAELNSLFLESKNTKSKMRRNLRGGQEQEQTQVAVPEQITNPVPVSEPIVPTDSATSVPDAEEKKEIAVVVAVPEAVSSVMYHVVLDCDYGDFVDDTKRQNRAAVVFGKLAKHIDDRIKVDYNKEDSLNYDTI